METDLKDRDNIKKRSSEEINRMLAYGSVGLGLISVKEESESEKRLKEDIKG